MTDSPEYRAWSNMLQRCRNPNNPQFKHYGARGIGICARWRKFTTFLEDMGQRPSPCLSLHRINNDDDYTPANCKWATVHEQAGNRRPACDPDDTLCLFIPEPEDMYLPRMQLNLAAIDADHPLSGRPIYPTDAFAHWRPNESADQDDF